MGGDLTAVKEGKVPSFMVYALRDTIGGNLDRIQIVKGWLDKDGKTHEKIYDVAWGDAERRKPGKNSVLPPVGDTVDVVDASWYNTIGDPELITVWKDPDFDLIIWGTITKHKGVHLLLEHFHSRQVLDKYKLMVEVRDIAVNCYWGHEIGDVFEVDPFNVNGTCSILYGAMYPYIHVLLSGAAPPWAYDEHTVNGECPDTYDRLSYGLTLKER